MSVRYCRVVFVGPDKDIKFMYQENQGILSDCQLKDGEILAAVRMSGICERDLELDTDSDPDIAYPCVPGHEAVAEVIESKRPDCDLVPGQRIVFSSMDTCRGCTTCKQNKQKHCCKRRKYGNEPVNVNSGYTGTFASHIVLGPGTEVVRVPDSVKDEHAVTVNCPLSCAVAIADWAPDSSICSTAIVQGATLVGLYCCVALRDKGYTRVFCSDQDRRKVIWSAGFGATILHPDLPNYGQVPLEKRVDFVVDTLGTPESMKSSLHYLSPGGTYVLVGVRKKSKKVSIPHKRITEEGITVRGLSEACPADLQKAMDLLSRTHSQYAYNTLVSEPIKLQDFRSALQQADKELELRVLVKP